jgi:hypothetical protein
MSAPSGAPGKLLVQVLLGGLDFGEPSFEHMGFGPCPLGKVNKITESLLGGLRKGPDQAVGAEFGKELVEHGPEVFFVVGDNEVWSEVKDPGYVDVFGAANGGDTG